MVYITTLMVLNTKANGLIIKNMAMELKFSMIMENMKDIINKERLKVYDYLKLSIKGKGTYTWVDGRKYIG